MNLFALFLFIKRAHFNNFYVNKFLLNLISLICIYSILPFCRQFDLETLIYFIFCSNGIDLRRFYSVDVIINNTQSILFKIIGCVDKEIIFIKVHCFLMNGDKASDIYFHWIDGIINIFVYSCFTRKIDYLVVVIKFIA